MDVQFCRTVRCGRYFVNLNDSPVQIQQRRPYSSAEARNLLDEMARLKAAALAEITTPALSIELTESNEVIGATHDTQDTPMQDVRLCPQGPLRLACT